MLHTGPRLVQAFVPACGLAICWLLSAAAAAQDTKPATAATKKINIVCTTGMVGDVARNVVGDRGEITLMMGEGVDPHLYKPGRSDIATLMNADMVFYNGLLLEGKMTDALVRVAGSGKKVVAITEQLDESAKLEPAQFQGHYDPHVWMDPRTWLQTVNVARDRLIEADASNADRFRKNAETYAAELKKLDEYAERVLATVPKDSRVLITAHDAFNYFGRRYGYEVVGIQGISTESEAGVRDIEKLVDLIVTRKIKAVFIETTVSQRNIEALIAGAKARGHEVKIGGKLFSDAMGKHGTYEGTYLGMIDHNVTTIVRALGGEAPARGMNGKLEEAK